MKKSTLQTIAVIVTIIAGLIVIFKELKAAVKKQPTA
jgi:hypothetical protein